MRLALVGSTGYIASALLKRFEQDVDIEYILKIDQTQEADVFFDLHKADKFKYDCLNDIEYVVFTAAISGPDRCSIDFNTCWEVNVTGTSYFIKEAMKRNCKVLFFSSDAVYGDIPGYIYNEESETAAKTPYGRMKKTVEDEFRMEKNFKAIRLSYVISAKDKFVSYCFSCIRNGCIAEIFHPFYRNCVVITDVVDAVCWLLQSWKEYKPFVLNIAGKELISRVRIADELNRNLKNSLKYNIVKPNDNFYKNRPSITQMESLYIWKYKILEDRSFTEKIKKELEEIDI